MNSDINYVKKQKNTKPVSQNRQRTFTDVMAEEVMTYHKSFPEYKETPLRSLASLGEELGVKAIYVKDESYRFGQNAFKVLGSSYAIGQYIAKKLGMKLEELDYEKITSPEIREKLGDVTFVTATDGNHGRGVAWTANRLKQKCVVYMPKGSAPERLNHIRALGAEACITELNYDDTVRLAAEHAEKYGWILIQDTAWEGYEEIPTWIMQGYMTMIKETVQQLGDVVPTHVFLQAGVGAMAGSMTGYLASFYKEKKPLIAIVEPDQADCVFQTAKADDGTLHMVQGDLATIMAGLACGEPCTIGWEIMKEYADCFVSMSDYIAAQGMRILGNPLGNDARIISGESGAAGFGLAVQILRDKNLANMKKDLELDENSVVLCISTEGDTDQEGYRRIVWDGQWPSDLFSA